MMFDLVKRQSSTDVLPAVKAFAPPSDYPEAMRAQVAGMRRAVLARKMVTRIISVVFYGCLLFLVILSAWLIAQATDRQIPTLTTVTITTPDVRPGADLRMDVHPHILRQCEGKVRFRALDRYGNIINNAETGWSFPMARVGLVDQSFSRPIRISQDAVPSDIDSDGKARTDARLRIERSFYCNWVQKLLGWPIVEISKDMPFAVVPAERAK